jgi:hypothetical protein
MQFNISNMDLHEGKEAGNVYMADQEATVSFHFTILYTPAVDTKNSVLLQLIPEVEAAIHPKEPIVYPNALGRVLPDESRSSVGLLVAVGLIAHARPLSEPEPSAMVFWQIWLLKEGDCVGKETIPRQFGRTVLNLAALSDYVVTKTTLRQNFQVSERLKCCL